MSGTIALPIAGQFSGLTEQGYINTALAALATMHQSATAPTTSSTGLASTAGLWWHDTGHNVILLRDAADANWLPVFYIDDTGHLVGTSANAASFAVVSGTANAIVVTYPVAPAAYVRGLKVAFKATANNTSTTTVNGINVFRKTSSGPAACAGGEIHTNDLVELEHDGTQWQIISGLPATGGTVTSVADATNGGVTVTGGTGAATIALAPSDLVAKTVPVGADVVVIGDSAASFAGKKSTLTQIQTAISSFASATEYAPTDQTITSGGTLTLAHGFGIRPKLVVLTLINQTTQGGWTAGQEIDICPATDASGTRGYALRRDTTNLVVQFGTDAAPLLFVSNAGVVTTLTPANWKLRVRAYA